MAVFPRPAYHAHPLRRHEEMAVGRSHVDAAGADLLAVVRKRDGQRAAAA